MSDKPVYEVEDCTSCPNLVENRSRIVNGIGSKDADLVLVGEAPGKNEDEGGEPFVGRSGEILMDAFAEHGVSRDEVYITNCVRCRPPDNRTPHVGELDACSVHLEKELELLQPDAVMALGSTPTRVLLGEKGPLGDIVGTEQDWEGDNFETTVIVSYHPAATLYDRDKLPTFENVVSRAAQFV